MTAPISSEDDYVAENFTAACVLAFNANDPSAAAGVGADTLSIACMGAHPMPVVTGVYIRDTAHITDHVALNDEAIVDQAQSILEDVSVQVIKVGFACSPENLSAIAGVLSDYADIPVVAHMPDLSWWDEISIETYLSAYEELLMSQITVLTGNYNTLCRWLLPEWAHDREPSARDLAVKAADKGVPYVLVTGVILPDRSIDNVLVSAQSVLAHQQFEFIEASFNGAGDTLSAALSALLATGMDLKEAALEALTYLDSCLREGFRPGMGHVIPNRLFWAEVDTSDQEEGEDSSSSNDPASELAAFVIHPHDTQH